MQKKNLFNTYVLLLLGKLTRFLLEYQSHTKQKTHIFHCYPVKLLTNKYKTTSQERLSSESLTNTKT